MGVEVNGKVKSVPKGGDQCRRGPRSQQASHVLDCKHMRTGRNHTVCELQPVVKGVEIFIRVQEVTGVAEPDLRHRACVLAHGLDCRGHLVDIVQGIKDAEDVHTGSGCLLYKGIGDLGWVRGVADGVPAPEEHLDTNVWKLCPKCLEALPRIFSKEPQRHVIGCSAPGLDA